MRDNIVILILFAALAGWMIGFPVLKPGVVHLDVEEVKYSECEFAGIRGYRRRMVGLTSTMRTSYLYLCAGKEEWIQREPEWVESNPEKTFRRHKK